MTPTTAAFDDDQRFLRQGERPDYEGGALALRVADLFAGCGALSLGLAEAAHRLGAAFDLRLAVEEDRDAAEVFQANFPQAKMRQTKVEALFDGELGASLTSREKRLAAQVGPLDAIVAGPPCQGHSSLNNHTRPDDPRNTLYARVVRAAEVLQPALVVTENVPGVVRDRQSAIPAAVGHLKELGYKVEHRTVDVETLGVPQRRRRHLLIAGRGLDPGTAFGALIESDVVLRDLRWAIGDLSAVEPASPFDSPSVLSHENRKRARWLVENNKYDLPNRLRPPCHADRDHTYKSMYGRLRWDHPAQTVTTGFGSPGQGRYLHPAHARTITPHEAARLQTIPDFFSFDSATRRGAWARMIGNAVPPLLSLRLGLELLPELIEPNQTESGELMEVA